MCKNVFSKTHVYYIKADQKTKLKDYKPKFTDKSKNLDLWKVIKSRGEEKIMTNNFSVNFSTHTVKVQKTDV